MPRRKLKLRLRTDVDVGEKRIVAGSQLLPSSAAAHGNSSLSISASKDSSTPRTPKSRRHRKSVDKKLNSKNYHHEIKELTAALSYPGWERDIEEVKRLVEKYHPNERNSSSSSSSSSIGDWVIASRIQGIQHKQQSFQGDRSHPHLQELDKIVAGKNANAAGLSYPGWPLDYQLALQAHYLHDNDWNWTRALFRLQQRQAMHQGDRSHPRLVELDQLLAKQELTYPGYERDIRRYEELHIKYADDYLGNNIVARQLATLTHRQQYWDGNCSLPEGLEEIRSQLAYSGWQDDVNTALEAHLHQCGVSSNGQIQDYNTAFHQLQHKHLIVTKRDRSHPRLVALDKVVSQASRDTALEQQPNNWRQLVQQVEDTHVRYPSDDWIGNAIFDNLLKALQKMQDRHLRRQLGSPVTSSPLSAFRTYNRGGNETDNSGAGASANDNAPWSPSTRSTTTLTMAPSWSSAEAISGEEDSEESEDETQVVNNNDPHDTAATDEKDTNTSLDSVACILHDFWPETVEGPDKDAVTKEPSGDDDDVTKDAITARASISRCSETRASF